jgi:thioredoxin 1
VFLLAAAVAGVMIAKNLGRVEATGEGGDSARSAGGLPRLVELGSDKCAACKMMKPVIDGFRRDFAGRLDVTFIDVWKNPEEAKRLEARIIPTQIFMAPDGTELFRHEGFWSREEILEQWKKLGVELETTPGDRSSSPGKNALPKEA